MHKIEIPHENNSIEFPESISEMNTDQYIMFSDLAFKFTTQQISYGEFKVQLTYILLNLERKVDMAIESEKTNRVAENVYRVSELMESFFRTESKGDKKFKIIKLEDIINHIPFFTISGTKYYGPKDALTSCSFGQYIQASNALHDFYNTKEEYHLNILVDTLYRPKGEEFNNESVDDRPDVHVNTSIGVKYGVYLFFAACQEWIVTNKKLSIGGGNAVDLTVLFKSNKPKDPLAPKGIGMLSALYAIAESGVFGAMDKTADQNLYDVLVYMVEKHNEVEKIKRDAKRKKSTNVSG
ncbi:hypothetical protein [Aquimarina megaterium]|uniref:hypothetical protein n=1 Tax=Aquimarina megaterium TaxID=1443666 RepID=UPI000945914A|nr:hypothetical protein [Aquimarina megaterium]